MRAVLLCAGFGTRLYPLTRDRAKPLLEVAGRPILEDLLAQLAAEGRVREVCVVTNGRFAAHFEAWRRDAAARLPGLSIDLVCDGARDDAGRLGAVRDLLLAVRRLELAAPLLVAAGDNLFRFDLGAFLDDFAASPRPLVLAVEEPDPERLRRTGVLELGPGGRVLRLHEKPLRPPSRWACPPLYLLDATAVAELGPFCASAPDTDALGHFWAWLARRRAVFAHPMRGSRHDVGDLASYRGAESWLAARGTSGS